MNSQIGYYEFEASLQQINNHIYNFWLGLTTTSSTFGQSMLTCLISPDIPSDYSEYTFFKQASSTIFFHTYDPMFELSSFLLTQTEKINLKSRNRDPVVWTNEKSLVSDYLLLFENLCTKRIEYDSQ